MVFYIPNHVNDMRPMFNNKLGPLGRWVDQINTMGIGIETVKRDRHRRMIGSTQINCFHGEFPAYNRRRFAYYVKPFFRWFFHNEKY